MIKLVTLSEGNCKSRNRVVETLYNVQTKLNLQSRIEQYCILQVHPIYLKIVCKYCFHAYNQHNYQKKCVLSFAKSLKSTKAKNLVKQKLLKKFSHKIQFGNGKRERVKKIIIILHLLAMERVQIS